MLYIANTTKQNQVFAFRTPESSRPYFLEIQSGQQAAIGEKWSDYELKAVIAHLELFGGRPDNQVNRNMAGFTGLLYRIGSEISENNIVAGHNAVVDMQEHRSAVEATRSAIAFDNVNKKRGKRLAKLSEVTVEQEIPRHEKPTGKEVKFSVAVTEDGRDSVVV